jgi:hypothetical protein
MRWRIVVGDIGNAQPAAEIDMIDGMCPDPRRSAISSPRRAKALSKGSSSVICEPMCMSMPDTWMPGSLPRLRVDLAGAAARDAELVFRLAGRDLGVGLGIHIRIDAHRHPGGLAHLGRDPRQLVQFRLGFDVETQDVLGQRIGLFGFGLADAGEHDLVAGTPAARARRSSPSETTSMPAPEPGQCCSTAWLELAFIA